jgi:hypothetical protein
MPFVGIRNELDLRALLFMQCDDGGWDAGLVYEHPSSFKIANRGLATALVVQAIEETGR